MDFAEILAKISGWAWPIVTIFLGILFRAPISKAIGRVNEVEIKGVKFKLSELEAAVNESEFLKSAIKVSAAGKEIDIPEIKALIATAEGMESHLIKPEKQFIKNLLEIAVKDDKLSEAEQEALYNITSTYDYPVENTRRIIEEYQLKRAA